MAGGLDADHVVMVTSQTRCHHGERWVGERGNVQSNADHSFMLPPLYENVGAGRRVLRGDLAVMCPWIEYVCLWYFVLYACVYI